MKALIGAFALASVLIAADDKGSTDDALKTQIAILKTQLAESLKATARCEADGPHWAKFTLDAQEYGQALIKALDAKGLMLDGQNKIVEKPKPAVQP